MAEKKFTKKGCELKANAELKEAEEFKG